MSFSEFAKPRPLEESDFHKGYLELLSYISKSSSFSFSEFCMQIKELTSFIWVIEDQIESRIITSASLLIEKKLIRNGGKVGHIEDLVVHPNYQKKGLGKKMTLHLIQLSKNFNCYKVILNCLPKLTKFYENLGFEKKQEQMSIYF